MNIDAGRLATLKQRYQKELGSALIKPNGPSSPAPRAILQIGRRLRDEALHQYPILPLAIQVYVELAATREWTISGEPKHVERSLDWVNNAESMNTSTGLVDYGYETLLRRKALDHVVIGMTTFASSPDIDDPAPLEYIDPTLLRFRREEQRIKKGMVTKVRPEEKCWIYASAREIQSQHLIHNYANPLGAMGFTSPILSLLPSASLAWLIRESDMMNIDGRKIRDLILVSDTKIGDAIEQGVYALLSLWKGDSEDDTGIPIIAVNGLQQGMPVRDTFAKLGISEIPETLKREEFTFAYVNEIAAALGLSLRHFWNNERTTNRALEEVQEQRQQQKGPSTFVRTEQRLMNRSGFLDRFGSVRKKPRFAFVEETDLSSMKDRAEALKNLATAFGLVMDRMGLFIKPESAVAWFQMENLLPHEIELIDISLSGQVVNPDNQMNTGNDQTSSSDPKPTAEPTQDAPQSGEALEKSLEYGEIVMSGTTGRVVARRHKIYPIEKILKEEIKREIAEEEKIYEGTYIDETDLKDWLKVLSTEAESHNVRLVQRLGDNPFLDKWLEKHPSDQSAIHNCLKNIDIADDELLIIDRVALAWEAQNDS